MICFYQGTYGERVGQSLESIRRVAPYVDRAIVLVDESVTEEQKEKLRGLGCEVYFEPWKDSTVAMRNAALDKIQTEDWVVTADPDEFFCDEFCRDIRKICAEAERNGADLVLINSHDVTIQKDGTATEAKSSFYKNLVFRKRPGTHYTGVGDEKVLHEELVIPLMGKIWKLPDKYYYRHVKYWHEVWERAARNVFIAGGGNNAGKKNPSWMPLRRICDELGLDTWPKAREYFRRGNIDPRLKEWLWENRHEGFDYDHEEMEFGRWYFEYLHPEEAEYPDGRRWQPVLEVDPDSPAGVMRYVEECYMQVLGRHADQPGKEVYTKAILEGKIRKEDLPKLLRASEEYRERQGEGMGMGMGMGMEKVKVQIPVNVSVAVSTDTFIEALKRSSAYWDEVKPVMDVGRFLKKRLGEKWKGFEEWFYLKRGEIALKDLAKKLEELEELEELEAAGGDAR